MTTRASSKQQVKTQKLASKEPGKLATMTSPKTKMVQRRRRRRFTEMVGPETYAVWVAMLQTLVPSGRTHRLAVVLAGMYQYATEKAKRLTKRERVEGTLAASLVAAYDAADPEEVKKHIRDAVLRLFEDAGVKHQRITAGGEKYSIADAAYVEYADWDNYP